MKNRFDTETKRAFVAAQEMFNGGKRTVSIHDIALKCGRESDPRWMTRIQNILAEFVDAFQSRGVKALAVNAYCVRHCAETAIADPLVAMKCVQLRSGGNAPAGIRVVRDDDAVFDAHLQSLISLAASNATSVLHQAHSAEAVGILSHGRTSELANAMHASVATTVRELSETPRQPMLPD